MFMHEEVERPRQQVSALMLAKAQKARRKGMEQTGLDMRPFVIHYFHFAYMVKVTEGHYFLFNPWPLAFFFIFPFICGRLAPMGAFVHL